MLTSLCLFLSLIFHIIRKKNALETTKKVSCSIIYFLVFAKSKFQCNFSRCFCFSPASERLAGEDGCNSGYCFGASESFVTKISVFFEFDVLLVYVLKRFRPGIQQVYKGFLRVLCYCLSSLIIFSLSRFKKTYCFQLSHCLKFTDYLLKFNKCKRLLRI